MLLFRKIGWRRVLCVLYHLWKMDNVTVTPQLSSVTKNYLPRSFEIFKHNLKIYLNHTGEYMNVIDLKKGY